MLKYQQMVELLSQRVSNGEYPGGKLPPLRQLADSIGVSYLTARKAVKELKDSGLIAESSRKFVIERKAAKRPQVCMITPFWVFTEWHRIIRDVTNKYGGYVHFVTYGSETDPAIAEALSYDFDVVFANLPPGRKNADIIKRLQKLAKKAVVLFHDKTDLGIRSLLGASPEATRIIMQKLYDHGCRSIDIIGTGEKYNTDVDLRAVVWRQFLDEHNMQGELFNPLIKPFEHSENVGYHYCTELLGHRPLPDAFFCMTPALAMGLYRACYERGIQVGKDISVFSFGHQAFAGIMTPALATVDTSSQAEPLVDELIRQYLPGNEPDDRLLFRSDKYKIIWGESLKLK